MTRKDILNKSREYSTKDKEVSGMLESLIQLKFHYIPQLLQYFEPIKEGNRYFPHMVKLKEKFKNLDNKQNTITNG